MLISEVYSRIRNVILNDPDAAIYTNAVLLICVQMANEELGNEFAKHGIAVQKTVETDIEVEAGELTLDLPSNIITPVKLWERAAGSSDAYVPMTKTTWPEDRQQGTSLEVWDWRDQEVNFIGATTDREVRLDYVRLLTSITDASGTNPVEIIGSQNYLAYKAAAIAAKSVGGNIVISKDCESDAAKHLRDCLQIGVRVNQSNPKRRKGFRRRRFPFIG